MTCPHFFEHLAYMEELRRIASRDQFERTDLPASGPLIVSETTDRPWTRTAFKRVWREIARAAGLSDSLQNRDDRPGAATAGDAAGAPRENTQKTARPQPGGRGGHLFG
jgi:hypothetical protein